MTSVTNAPREKLPRGVWFEADKKRYRVRRYKNKKTYLIGYYKTLDEALEAKAELDNILAEIPKEPRGSAAIGEVPRTGFSSTVKSLRKDQVNLTD